MKLKILLFVVSIIAVLASCKKDSQSSPEPDPLTVIKQQIIGGWSLTAGKEVYYDEAGKVVKTEEQEITEPMKYEFIDSSMLKRYDPEEKIFEYNLVSINSKIYMNVNNVPYEISINNDNMLWSFDQAYQDKDYSKGVITYSFKRL